MQLEEKVKEANDKRVSVFCPIAQCKCRVDCDFLVKASIKGKKVIGGFCIINKAILLLTGSK